MLYRNKKNNIVLEKKLSGYFSGCYRGSIEMVPSVETLVPL